MRFVSDKRGLSITVEPGTPEVRDPASGAVTRAATPDVEAKFTHDLLDEDAIRLAMLPRSQGGLANTDRRGDGSLPDSPFRGTQQDESGKMIPVQTRLSVFDSEAAQLQNGWSDETRERVEQKMLAHSYLGSLYVLVEGVPAAMPWNGYDSVSDPEQVINIAGLINADFGQILAYEKANQNRPEIVAALTDEIASLEETEIVVSA